MLGNSTKEVLGLVSYTLSTMWGQVAAAFLLLVIMAVVIDMMYSKEMQEKDYVRLKKNYEADKKE